MLDCRKSRSLNVYCVFGRRGREDTCPLPPSLPPSLLDLHCSLNVGLVTPLSFICNESSLSSSRPRRAPARAYFYFAKFVKDEGAAHVTRGTALLTRFHLLPSFLPILIW